MTETDQQTSNNSRPFKGDLIEEEPLLFRVDGKPYAVVMRTPGEEIAHGAGFCLAEGLVDHRQDIVTIDCYREEKGLVVSVTLTKERHRKVEPLLDRQGYFSKASCGICGKQLLDDLYQILTPNRDKITFAAATVEASVAQLPRQQALYKKTGSSHGAMLFDGKGQVLAIGEDVGRHNALDKVIGKLLMADRLKEARLCVLSSRISYELVQKSSRARIPVLTGISRPTSLAVALARRMHMTLAWMSRRDGLYVYSGKERIVDKNEAPS